ncbi:MAG: sodium:proton antiporter [Chloroherpetonaceae bacterium]|nr:sodium:proton antiporter [Chloroherpetonaceae bacterium]MDW8018778.1 sodium:proton antiporter [Chloroherpetonaceae bacterium]
MAYSVPAWSLTPFVLMLGAIAVFPLAYNHWWEHNRNKLIVAVTLSLPIVVYLIATGHWHELEHALIFDYVPFVILLGSLFVITGGIRVTGDIEAKPIINTAFLAIGAVLASFIGTTGAATLLIRPILQTNKERMFKVHTVLFFIGAVANCGGLLTPLGDPPLFILYLRGVPFDWFLQLLPQWLMVNLLLLLIYFGVDTYFYDREPIEAIRRDVTEITPIRVRGLINFVWLLGVVLSVAYLNEQYVPTFKEVPAAKFLREVVIASFAGLSLVTTKKEIREGNNFTWAPIEEVAYLFLGIFITMVPCILYLEANAKSLGVSDTMQFYYATGALSAVLDNTPTALTFYSLAVGLAMNAPEMVAGVPAEVLQAISVAAVFFGSLTYIGNGPNFMVKAVAEENGVRMPDFFAYMYKFSLVVLLPLFVLVQILFF